MASIFRGTRVLLPFCILTLLLSCGSKKHSVQPVEPDLVFSAYAHLDTSGFRIVQSRINDDSCGQELYLWWEKNFGEPFTDLNGNGVYDSGIDYFVRSSNPAVNQDLNYNGRYDPPDGYWDGTPFDDLDNDGICRQEDEYSGIYRPGTPFADMNGNGVWDQYPPYYYAIVSFSAQSVDSETIRYSWTRPFEQYTFTSDSGVTYRITLDSHYSFCPLGSFLVSDSSFAYSVFNYEYIPVLLAGDRFAGFDTVAVIWRDTAYSPVSMRRQISVGATLVLAGDTLRDLVRVVCDSLRFADPYAVSDCKSAFFEFYLDPTDGPVAIISRVADGASTTKSRFDRRLFSLPVSLVR